MISSEFTLMQGQQAYQTFKSRVNMGVSYCEFGLGDASWDATGKKGWDCTPNKSLWTRAEKEVNIKRVNEYNTSKV